MYTSVEGSDTCVTNAILIVFLSKCDVFCLASHTSYGLLETRMKSILSILGETLTEFSMFGCFND